MVGVVLRNDCGTGGKNCFLVDLTQPYQRQSSDAPQQRRWLKRWLENSSHLIKSNDAPHGNIVLNLYWDHFGVPDLYETRWKT